MSDPTNAHEARMAIKKLIRLCQEDFPNFDFVGEVDEVDILIEALIHPELFEVAVRSREV